MISLALWYTIIRIKFNSKLTEMAGCSYGASKSYETNIIFTISNMFDDIMIIKHHFYYLLMIITVQIVKNQEYR